MQRQTLEERFWSKVKKGDPASCWEWQGWAGENRYGRIGIGKTYFLAHRVSWELANGKTIPDGMVVMHKCDNPSCVNPSHLTIGTPRDNALDAISKGRWNTQIGNHQGFKKGHISVRRKLTPEQAKSIKAALTNGASLRELSGQYTVPRMSILLIKRNQIYREA